MIRKYKKKPVINEALQWLGNNEEKMEKFIGEGRGYIDGYSKELYIRTLEGELKVNISDFVIKGVNGEFYPCRADIFEATYEENEKATIRETKEVKKYKPKIKLKFISFGTLLFPINRIDYFEKICDRSIALWTVSGDRKVGVFNSEEERDMVWVGLFRMLNGVEND